MVLVLIPFQYHSVQGESRVVPREGGEHGHWALWLVAPVQEDVLGAVTGARLGLWGAWSA